MFHFTDTLLHEWLTLLHFFFFYIFAFVHCDIIVTKLDQQNAHTLRQAYVSRLCFG